MIPHELDRRADGSAAKVKLVRDGTRPPSERKVNCAATAARILQQYLDGTDREHFAVLLLDA